MKITEFINLNPTQNKYTFGKFVRLRREELGITLRKMAKKLEITASYLSDVENGERYAPIKILNQMKKELMISPCEEEIFNDLAFSLFIA